MNFEPLDPNFKDRVKESFARQGFMTHLNAKLEVPAAGACDIRILFGPRVAQQHGYFHGGVVGALADAAGAYAGFTLLPSTATILTVEYKVNLIAPARGDILVARGRVLKGGRTLIVVRSDVSTSEKGVETVCATALVTMMALDGRPDGPPSTSRGQRS
ncbi:MAG: PaaI family thioesterase [Pararhodobacter sp.]